MAELVSILSGATVMGFLVGGLFFLRFWRDTGDRLFVSFAIAMWTLALNGALVAVFHPGSDSRHYFYLLRLFAFVLIIWAVVDKNRSDPDRPPGRAPDRS
ncbi:MAG TPA: DUF5985 family protein [Candidatus Binatia bacterium]|nr:DUF5985 family protein [Candidatus Binatia bacterium]